MVAEIVRSFVQPPVQTNHKIKKSCFYKILRQHCWISPSHDIVIYRKRQRNSRFSKYVVRYPLVS